MALSIRMPQQEEELFREFIKEYNYNISEYVRGLIKEAMDDALDLQAIKEFEEEEKAGKIKYITAEEMFRRIGL